MEWIPAKDEEDLYYCSPHPKIWISICGDGGKDFDIEVETGSHFAADYGIYNAEHLLWLGHSEETRLEAIRLVEAFCSMTSAETYEAMIEAHDPDAHRSIWCY